MAAFLPLTPSAVVIFLRALAVAEVTLRAGVGEAADLPALCLARFRSCRHITLHTLTLASLHLLPFFPGKASRFHASPPATAPLSACPPPSAPPIPPAPTPLHSHPPLLPSFMKAHSDLRWRPSAAALIKDTRITRKIWSEHLPPLRPVCVHYLDFGVCASASSCLSLLLAGVCMCVCPCA